MIKTQFVVYNAKNYTTGLNDVTANVFLDPTLSPESAVATGLALVELNATTAAGRYTLILTPTQINSFGGAGTYFITINSASKNAPATAKLVVEINGNDDLEAHLVVIEGKIDTLTTNLAALQGDVTSVKSTVEDTNTKVSDGTTGLAAIKALIDTALSGIGSIQQSTRTVVGFPNELISPATGSKVYEILINIYNTQGSLEDPDSSTVNVSLQNAGGLDRGNLFNGGGASPKAATKIATGRYKIELTIPAGTSKEQINMLVNYTENSTPLEAVRTANIVSSVDASGLAQQLTLQEVLDDTSVMQPQVASIQSEIQNATYGLAALQSALVAIDALVNSNNGVLLSPTIGNQAIIDALALTASQTSLNNLISSVDDLKGAGFNASTDSNKALADKLEADLFTGGSAV